MPDTNTKSLVEDPEIQHILRECCWDTGKFAKTFLTEQFTRPFKSYAYTEFLRRIDSTTYRKEVIAAPRGMGKTSLVRALILRSICFQHARFIVFVTKNWENAQLQTEHCRRELLSNKKLRHVFGDPRVSRNSDYDEAFSKRAWVANIADGGTLVVPKGMRQPIRGMLFGMYRPDLIILDDAEDKDEITNEDNRERWYDWVLTDAALAPDLPGNTYRMIYVDTLKHEDAVLQRLIKRDDWRGLELELFDDNLHSRIPEYLDDAWVAETVSAHRKAGTLDYIWREMRNKVIAGEAAAFRGSYFKYYDDEVDFEHADLEAAVLVDPAKSANPGSADSAIVGIAMDYDRKRVYVRDIDAGRFTQDVMYEKILNMADRIHANVIGLEVTGLKDYITHPFHDYMIRHNRMYNVVELKPRKGEGDYSARGRGKEGRIAAMIPYYREGLIYHNPQSCSLLEAQLLSFPRSARWDVMDALSYFVQLFAEGDRFLAGPPVENAEIQDSSIALDMMDLEGNCDLLGAPGHPLANWSMN